jgi:CubicO group peptidase (beta-lactamase class C family)
MENIDKAHSIDQIVQIAFKGDFIGEPGEKWVYCNTGFTISAALVEKLSGLKFADYLRNKIFLPLNMENTYVCDVEHDALNAIQRYMSDTIGYINARKMHFSNLIGGGSVISNSRDIAKWCMALISGENMPDNYQSLWYPVLLNSGKSTNYGLGMGFCEINGKFFIIIREWVMG